ncbi:MAG: tetratricopeptide repeat protein [Armatimonadota bacterium]
MPDAALTSPEPRTGSGLHRRPARLLLAALALAVAALLVWRSDPVQDWWLSRQPLERLEELLKEDPTCPRLRYHLSRAHYLQGDWSDGMSQALEGLRLNPGDTRLLQHVGKLHRGAAADREALPFFQRAYALGDRSQELLENLAEIEVAAGSPGARSLVNATVRRYPESSLCWWLLSRLDRRDGDLPAARRALELAVETGPEEFRYQRELARLHLDAREPAAALEAVRRSLERNPADRESWLIRAQALEMLGTAPVEEVDTAYRRAEFDPYSPTEQTAYIWRDHGIFLLNSGRSRDAILPLEQAVQVSPRDRAACAALIRAYREIGERARASAAAQWLRRCEETDRRITALRGRLARAPGDTSARARLVRLLRAEGLDDKIQLPPAPQ